MKTKVISVLLTLMLLAFVFLGVYKTPKEEVPEEISSSIEDAVNTIIYPDYSLLYTCKLETGIDTCISVNIQDANLLMKIARAEGGPTLDGQLWAMRTIFNRLYNGSFGNSIWEIVSNSGQFDVFITGEYINADVNPNTHIALAMIEGGWDETDGALYWRTDAGSENSWHERQLQYIATVEGNRYYK